MGAGAVDLTWQRCAETVIEIVEKTIFNNGS